MTLFKDDDARLAGALVCMVVANIPQVLSSPPALKTMLDELATRRATEDFPPPGIKTPVRDMLRLGGFKPAGRQKPSSEYLGQAAREGRFPSINGPVDCNNVLSLDLGLPISLLDADATGPDIIVRVAPAGVSYVFNASGQEMDLEGLLCIYGGFDAGQGAAVPLGNPVKDSMQGKIKDHSRRLAGFIYAPPALYTPATLAQAGERFAAMLRDYCGADAAVAAVV